MVKFPRRRWISEGRLARTGLNSGLEPLHRFIKQENKVVPIHFQLPKKHDRQTEFIERKMPEIAPRPLPPTPLLSSPRPALPLFDAPADKPPRGVCVRGSSEGESVSGLLAIKLR